MNLGIDSPLTKDSCKHGLKVKVPEYLLTECVCSFLKYLPSAHIRLHVHTHMQVIFKLQVKTRRA